MKKIIYRFGHCADLHLGVRPRGIRQRKLDVFDSYMSMCESMVDSKVNSTLISGDFFHTKVVDFETMDMARSGLSLLKNCGVDTFACTGNHDHVFEYQWTRFYREYLSDENIYDGIQLYRKGDSCINLYKIDWINASSLKDEISKMRLLEDIRDFNPTGKAFNVLMLHQAVEGYIHNDEKKNYIPKDYIEELKQHFDYIALGHIHSSYIVDDFCFNPGSIEYLSTTDWNSTTGWFLVNIYDDLSFDYELIESRKRDRFNLKILSNELKTIDKDEICGIIEKYGVTQRAMLNIEFIGTVELSPRIIKIFEQAIHERFSPVFLKVRNFTIPKQMELIPQKEVDDIYKEVFADDAEVAREVASLSREPDKIIEVLK